MTLEELNPDEALASLLDGKVEVQTSETERHTVRCYADGKQPNKGVADEFLTVMWNGAAESRTYPPTCFKGGLALTVYCKAHADNTAKTQRVRQMIRQCQTVASGMARDGFFFKVNPTQVITPTVVSSTTGYSTTTINVEWRTLR